MPTDIPRTPPRRVDFITNKSDFLALNLARFGFSTKFIAEKTGLSAGQVVYRIHKTPIRRSDFRNGQSPEARALLRFSASQDAKIAAFKHRLEMWSTPAKKENLEPALRLTPREKTHSGQ